MRWIEAVRGQMTTLFSDRLFPSDRGCEGLSLHLLPSDDEGGRSCLRSDLTRAQANDPFLSAVMNVEGQS